MGNSREDKKQAGLKGKHAEWTVETIVMFYWPADVKKVIMWLSKQQFATTSIAHPNLC